MYSCLVYDNVTSDVVQLVQATMKADLLAHVPLVGCSILEYEHGQFPDLVSSRMQEWRVNVGEGKPEPKPLES